jgi:cytidylate kinase
MNTHAYLEHGMAILKTRLENPGSPIASATTPGRPFITLSREVCAGASTLGSLLLPRLNAEFDEPGHEWILLDKDLVTCALRHHQLSEHLAEYLPEDKISEIDAAIGEIVGLHPSIWKLEHQVAQAIVQLAYLGCFIFVGRAAHLLTWSLPGGFHVRLVAPMETRVRRYQEMSGATAQEARAHLARTDEGRRRFVKSHFDRDIDDPHTYDLVINTDRIPADGAVRLVLDGLRQRVATLEEPAPLG